MHKQRHLLCCLFVYEVHILLALYYVKQSFYTYVLMLCSMQTCGYVSKWHQFISETQRLCC
jgi:hypothetical protein